MTRQRALSRQALALLSALADAKREWRHGLSLAEKTGLKSGTLYPLLIRLAEQGYLDAKWVPPDPPGRPPRHAYRITPAGLAVLKAQHERANAKQRLFRTA